MKQLKIDPKALCSPQSTESLQRQNARKTLILQRQRILFSAYRSDQYTDPESYMASLGIVFEDYKDDVIIFVTDPKTGVQRTHKWPPAISEIVEALNDRSAYLAQKAKYENWGNNEQLTIEGPKEERPTLEEMHEKYGKNWGLGVDGLGERPDKPAPSWGKITEAYGADPTRLAALLTAKDK